MGLGFGVGLSLVLDWFRMPLGMVYGLKFGSRWLQGWDGWMVGMVGTVRILGMLGVVCLLGC